MISPQKYSANLMFSPKINRSPVAAAYRGARHLVNTLRIVIVYGDGSGSHAPIADEQLKLILREIRTKNGKLKKSLNSHKVGKRAYYVWRMARWHGGADPKMPMTATLYVNKRSEGEDNIKILDKLADVLAVANFGSDLNGAKRWGKALGFLP